MSRRLLLVALVGALGCAESPPPAGKSDPHIRVRDTVGGNVGPVGGARGREYEGPASQAPDWARPKAQPGR